jgi:hypothetical protein
MSTENQRTHFRVVYPQQDRPTFVTVDGSAPVLDCSEGGLRVELGYGHRRPALRERVNGQLRLRDGQQLAVAGRVVRVQGREVCLELERPGLPLSVIFSEQRFLRTRYAAI